MKDRPIHFAPWIPAGVIMPKQEYTTYLAIFSMHTAITSIQDTQDDLLYLDRLFMILSKGGTTT